MEDNSKKIKIIFLGNQGVGKSAIIQRYINNAFIQDYQATIGLDFLGKTVTLNNKPIRLLLYDTAGQEKYKSLIPMYIRNSNVIIIVYDITNRDSFELTNNWIKETADLDQSKTFYVLLGNKTDLEDKRVVSREEGMEFAKGKDFIFDEISAKTGDNVENVFNSKIIPKIQSFILHETPETITTEEEEEEKKVENNNDVEIIEDINENNMNEENNNNNQQNNIQENTPETNRENVQNNNITLKQTKPKKKKGCCGGNKEK